jgi:hypothetical protein
MHLQVTPNTAQNSLLSLFSSLKIYLIQKNIKTMYFFISHLTPSMASLDLKRRLS